MGFCRRDLPSYVDTPWWADDRTLLTRGSGSPVRGISHAIESDFPHCCERNDIQRIPVQRARTRSWAPTHPHGGSCPYPLRVTESPGWPHVVGAGLPLSRPSIHRRIDGAPMKTTVPWVAPVTCRYCTVSPTGHALPVTKPSVSDGGTVVSLVPWSTSMGTVVRTWPGSLA